jgi:hypothetical protein
MTVKNVLHFYVLNTAHTLMTLFFHVYKSLIHKVSAHNIARHLTSSQYCVQTWSLRQRHDKIILAYTSAVVKHIVHSYSRKSSLETVHKKIKIKEMPLNLILTTTMLCAAPHIYVHLMCHTEITTNIH